MDPFSILTSGIFTAMDSKAKLVDASLAGAMLQYGTQQQLFENINDMIGLRQELESRITSILSDYTQMINQVSIVSTLALGMGLGAFGSLLGNVDDQPEWKIVLFTYSCVLTISFSVMSVIESFFLAIHINQVEARFVGGVYPHITKDKRRSFAMEELEDLNSNLNFIILTFFISFLIFSTTILGTVYIGLGLSNNVFAEDLRIINVEGQLFQNDTRWDTNTKNVSMSVFEPTYVAAAVVLTFIVITTYALIVYRFLSSYVKQIHGRRLLRFLLLCSCIDPTGSTSLKTPMTAAATRFNDLQHRIGELTEQWFHSTIECTVSILNFQEEHGTVSMKNFLSDQRKKFKLLKSKHGNLLKLNPEFTLDLINNNKKKKWTEKIRIYKKKRNQEAIEYQKKMKKKLSNAEDKTMGELVWDEVEKEKDFYVSAFDISILTLSHGCGKLTSIIRRASQEWRADNNKIAKFMVDNTTRHVVTSLEARTDFMKQHITAENVEQPPKLSYKVSGRYSRLVLMFLFVYLTFGIVGSIISVAFAVLWLVWYNISTCFSYSPCFCLCCWKGTGIRHPDKYYCCGAKCSNMQHVKDCSTCCIRYIGKLKKNMIDNELAKSEPPDSEEDESDKKTDKIYINQHWNHSEYDKYYDHINF